jgi:histidinol-phosphate aminotransferase
MNVLIPDHIAALKSYQPGKTIEQLKKEFGWTRTAILWNNENTLGYSPKSKEAVMQAYDGINFYPDPQSTDLRRALSTRLNRKPEEIILGNGSESVLMLAIRALCSGDDEFLTSEGSFVVIYNWARINNVRCVAMPMNAHFGFDLDAIKNRISRNTKIIYLANANNPTGTMIPFNQLKQFVQSVPDHILVIVDEAYFEFSKSLDPEFPDSMEFEFPNVLTLRTFSKAYGIAGVRLGYGVGHPKVMEAMYKARLTFEPSLLAQAAGLGALADTEFLKNTMDNNTQGLSYLYASFDKLEVDYVRSYGNFVMTVWDSESTVQKVFNSLIKKGVLVRPLAGALSHCIRITVGRPDENEWLIENLENIRH